MQADNQNYPLVSLNDAAKMCAMSRTMVNRYRTEGRFPVAVKLGERRIAFVRAEVEAWIDERVNARAAA